MPIEPLLTKYFLDYPDLSANQRQYVADSLRLWYLSGLLKTVYKTQGGADFDTLAAGTTVACSIRTGNTHLDHASFEREVQSYERHGPVSSGADSNSNLYDSHFNLSLVLGLGFQIEFCLSEETRETVRALYEARPTPRKQQHNSGETSDVQKRSLGNLSFGPGMHDDSYHHYWAESLAAFSFKQTRDQLLKSDPKIYAILSDLVMHPESIINSKLREDVLANRKELAEANETASNLLD